MRNNGDTAWSKKLVYPYFPDNLFNIPTSVSIGDQNHTYLVGTRNFLTRVDSGGNLLANKMIKGADTLSIKSMVMASDGDKVLLLESGGWEKSAFLVRVSSDLSVIKWVRNIESKTDYDRLKIWKIVLNGNQVACVGYHEVFDRKGMVLAFDYTSGQLLHSKGLPFTSLAPSFFNIQPFDSGYIINGWMNYNSMGGDAIIKMDTAFNIKSVYWFKDYRTYGSTTIRAQKDGGFYRLSTNNNFTQLLHVNKNNIIDFKTHFALWYISSFTHGIDVHETPNNLFFTLTANSLDLGINNLATYLGVYKTSLAGYVGNCNLYDDVVGYETVPLSEIVLPPVRVKDDYITISDFFIQTELLPLTIDKLCTAVSTCNALKIIGANNTCTNQIT